MPLTADQTALVQATVPALEQHGNEITSVFYKNMLEAHPELNNIFNSANQVHQHQPKALAAAVYAYAKNIENIAALIPTVKLISGKHASLGVKPEHYPIVGKYLLEAFQEVLGDAITPEILSAWAAAYQQLADVFIGTEKAMYDTSNAWTDFEEFRIARIDKESDEISSFYLRPVRQELLPLPTFHPGQYISVQVQVPAVGYYQARQYSLSDAPRCEYYRVSIKRHSGGDHPDGLVSNLMHSKKIGDIIKVSHPQGHFFLDTAIRDPDSPVVLISAGVGLTPMTSILNTLSSDHSPRPILWVHAARSSNIRAFAKHIQDVRRQTDNMQIMLCNSRPERDEVKGQDYDHEGYVDAAKLEEFRTLLANPKTEVFICGPNQFMLDMQRILAEEFKVPKSNIKMELFGTGGPSQS